MATIKSLVDPELNRDDVTILLLKRTTASASGSALRSESLVQQTGQECELREAPNSEQLPANGHLD
jgi:hypothetical protein